MPLPSLTQRTGSGLFKLYQICENLPTNPSGVNLNKVDLWETKPSKATSN